MRNTALFAGFLTTMSCTGSNPGSHVNSSPSATRLAQPRDLMAACLHWPGEEPYDERRSQEIQNGIERDCPAAVSAARQVQDQLADDPEASLLAIRMAAHFGEQFDAKSLLTPSNQAALCKGAQREIDKLKSSGEDDNFPYYDLVCPDSD
ncbi:MAG: hypothetical protein AAF735_01640 [Myxococcota bacterium]